MKRKTLLWIVLTITVIAVILIAFMLPQECLDHTTEVFELVYYIAFVVLTILLCRTGVLTYNEQKKKPAKVLPRVNYNYETLQISRDGHVPVTIDLYNEGDSAWTDLNVRFELNGETVAEEMIPYIAPHETYKFAVGWLGSGVINWNNLEGPVDSTFICENPQYEYTWDGSNLTVSCDEGNNSETE